ncbi:hypothetical protein [Nocardioides coralli]|uniref:hypothetical protein n=1 Tax=Nocardioides coralli TaxID=2872154 RepID=UPI001CA3EFF0|nr:hypothetical protein [Nocardioides coralli]QZY27896.1 hypothetical protein K6T13_10315 [Nocardioides coralli]
MTRRPHALALIVTCLVAALLALPGSATGAPEKQRSEPRFRHLDPGGQPDLDEKVPVNVVFVGHEPSEVNASAFRAALPSSASPVVRSRLWYGEVEELGIDYAYDYQLTFADDRYEDRLFRYLRKIAKKKPLTQFQQAYNDQAGTLDVTSNAWIDATKTEKWLAFNPPSGVDTRQPTIYLVDWFDRSDFQFHVYTKTDEPEPDTGYNFGKERDSRKLTAWGGTTAADEESGLGRTRRVWFHDLSAGPEAFAGSYDVENADLDGDSVPDYRIPPAWEYAPGGYRSPRALTGDLAKLVRYVFLDLLVTSSPIYPVELPTDEPPTSVNLDSNTYEGWAGVDASRRYIKPRLLQSEISEVLLGAKAISYDNQDFPLTGRARRCYEWWLQGRSCEPSSGLPPDANLYLQNEDDLARTKDDGDRVDYELPIFNYAVSTDDPTPLGFADDNWSDGTQSFVFNFINPFIVDAGYGLTTTQIHEVGHHTGLSHPHDGYDSESGMDFGPSGDFYFAWLGTSVNSIMSYIDLNWDFSQFDQDNMARFQAAAYIEATNRLAGEALAGPRPQRSYAELRRADRLVGAAERAFARHRYPQAWALAGRAYTWAVKGARDAGVDVERSIRRALRGARRAPLPPADEVEGATVDTLEPNDPRLLP